MRDHEGSTCQNVDLLSQSRAEHFTISRSKVKNLSVPPHVAPAFSRNLEDGDLRRLWSLADGLASWIR